MNEDTPNPSSSFPDGNPEGTTNGGAQNQAPEEKFYLGFSLAKEEIEDRLHVNLDGRSPDGYNTIVPLRTISVIEQIAMLRNDVLEALIRNITVRGSSLRPYQQSMIRVHPASPQGLYVGQTFVLQGKLLGLMENLEGRLKGHCHPGLSRLGPCQVYGYTLLGEKARAFYIPPLVEKHDNKDIILDGIHRSYLCRSSGATITCIHIRNVDTPIPFDPITWDQVKQVEEKPLKKDRYLNLQVELFRDLSVVGIDG